MSTESGQLIDWSLPENPWPKVLEWASAHPAFVLTVAYLYLSAVGCLYQWRFYGAFEVNYFDYAEANDFLVGAVKQPSSLEIVAVVLMIIVVYWFLFKWTYERLSMRFQSKRLAILGRVNVVSGLLLAACLSIVAPQAFGQADAERILVTMQADPGSIPSLTTVACARVRIGLTGGSGDLLGPKPVAVLGTTDKFIFLYGEDLHVVPLANLSALQMKNSAQQSCD